MNTAPCSHCPALSPCDVHASAGFTLIELLVTFSVLAVMLVLAAPSFIAFQRSSELTASANALLSTLSMARAEATKRQLNVIVEPGSPTSAAGASWASGWFAYVDVDSSTGYSTGDIVLSQSDPLPSSVEVNTIAGATGFVDSSPAVNRPYLMFNGSGFLRTLSGGFVTDSVLELRNVVGGEIRCVAASPSGRMRAFRPSAGAHCTVDTLPAPS